MAQMPEVQARMDEVDRLAYIKEQKKRLGLDDGLLMKSSKKTLFDSQRMKSMPALEFNQFFRGTHEKKTMRPHQMAWSGCDMRNPDFIEQQRKYEEEREEHTMKELERITANLEKLVDHVKVQGKQKKAKAKELDKVEDQFISYAEDEQFS
mmetsp:Transcript_6601/g.11132  ORF Transcript_6601/g.11132 Transcript_6601/m.11132 type:complete len:151 (+) Transcript_6601:166-618(+)|eukprot:CAMPEP_0168626040 /NCGR_PEP_ID=MMETSP0449_2-20121227/10393_1 /TAXON_ID=1082188 /ORGANISM="Strombidium rassoulzadegani, Strain ras09" /LENGTH=150 /DNA_ID=CAMNT_0008667955 /DNA_START=90 /DNA_END=542 /DNA_ORIENTATION=-